MIAGIDYSSFFIDTVLLDEDRGVAFHHHRRLDVGGGKALARARRVRNVMPARGAWEDGGVTLIAIEEPFHHSHQGLTPLLLVLGAIIACLPPKLPLRLVRADDWRGELGLKRRAPREVHKAAAIDFAVRHWENRPAKVGDDAADAFCIAWAAREIDRRSEARAA